MTRTVAPCVVHLVRHGNPLESVERFIDSYRRYDAGTDHRLVLLCKGFSTLDQLAPVLERLDGLRAERIDVPDDGYDLTAYRRAAERIDGAVACFLNSNSVILGSGWLETLLAALTPSTGIVGATGSWASAHSYACYLLGVPSAYAKVFPDRATHFERSRRHDEPTEPTTGILSHRPLSYAHWAYGLSRTLLLFRPFPASHLRTNAFAIRAETMRRLRFWPLRNKVRAWQLESGRGCITDQIQSMGLEVLVVGRDGRGYRQPEWASSETFWQGEQRSLLIADNQTERYRLGDSELRTMLSQHAWGPAAWPSPPPS
jgi:hypothetical protein